MPSHQSFLSARVPAGVYRLALNHASLHVSTLAAGRHFSHLPRVLVNKTLFAGNFDSSNTV